MFSIQIYFILNLILFLLILLLIFLKRKEYKMYKLRIFIVLLLVISNLELFLNWDIYMDSNEGESFSYSFLSGLNQMFLISSLILLTYSFFIRDQDVIELECPSLFKSRQGKVEIGKAMKKSRKKHKFYLPINDLERHMFVCGTY